MAAHAQSSRGERTREKILRCAERLFAGEGIDRATLRQIARSAGQKNVSAVQYHFGSKDELLRVIQSRHRDAIDERRRSLLNEHERSGTAHELRALVRVLVEPLAAELDDPSGRDYLQIQAQRQSRKLVRPAASVMTMGIARVLDREAASHDQLVGRFAVQLLFGSLAERAREESTRAPRIERKQFVQSLTDAMIGMLEGMGKAGPA